jgi:hypothetical protein
LNDRLIVGLRSTGEFEDMSEQALETTG